ncbi:TonB-dependent receptor [Marinobacter adhaerens]|uniref:TonB-dependent receptor n=1 Tax=Marinobacter adhaerens TaxID=1033846 RepID=A0A851HNG7_9GAMM|nr:TonB-dependent receptor [Marinobacter adhaerens]NWN90563.1 TonB-dependent receptor [Marinobacter adhaerens]
MPVTNFAVNLPVVRSCCTAALSAVLCVWVIFTPAADATPASAPGQEAVELYGATAEVPEVLTTARLRQSKTRVPGTTTIIEGEMIRDLGVMSLVEVFRLVPGMVVANVGSNKPVTTYHGTVHYEQRRMQVLVDGRTAYRTTLSDMDWHTMPVPLETIERIEVSRGPNSAAYGINAFLGTINIITRHPADTAGAEVRVATGSRGYLRTFGSVGNTSEHHDWRLAYEKRQFDGFDFQIKDGREIPFHNGHDINTFNYDSNLRIKPGIDADIRAGVVDGTDEEDPYKSSEPPAIENPDIDVRDYYLQTQLNFTPSKTHFFHLQVSFKNYDRRQRWPISVPESAIHCLEDPQACNNSGGAPVIIDVNADYEDSRLEFELQDTLLISEDLKLMSGLGYRENTFRSETYFNGRDNSYQSRLFGNIEYSPVNWLTLNGGGNWEQTTTTDEGYFSPRVAANVIFTRNHAVRFVYSRAVRTPDEFEQNPDYGYTLRNIRPAQYKKHEGLRVNSEDIMPPGTYHTLNRTLEKETITSREISYFGQFPMSRGQFTLEVRAFKDELRDMISGIIRFDRWTIDNNVGVDQQGAEVEAALEYPGTTVRASYGYLDQEGWYTGVDSAADQQKKVDLLARLSARHSGSLVVIKDLPLGVKASTAYYWVDQLKDTRFERLDLRLAKRIFQPRYTVELAATLQHYLDTDPFMSRDNNIKDQNQFFLEAGVRF